MSEIVIREAKLAEWNSAMKIAWETFLKYDAPDYTPEGIENFRRFIEDDMLRKKFEAGEYLLFVALDGEDVIGLITLREKNHISLLFVDDKYHKMGIGRKLVERLHDFMRIVSDQAYITVNAAPYAVKFYHKVGFIDKGLQVTTDGITYTPMELMI